MMPSGNDSTKPLVLTAELIHEALEQLGWQGDAHALAERIKRLDIGLPAEDEFAMILSWLGKCLLVHKLDELQSPSGSQAEYQVPDLVAAFNYKGQKVSVLIEVKATNKKALSWKPQYYESLRRYGELFGLPILVAWKYHNHWALFDLMQFERSHQNYKVRFETAFKESLMGILAGDWLFVLDAGVGLHLLFRKEQKLSEVEEVGVRKEEWLAVVEDAYFTDRGGERLTQLDRGLWQLFLSAPPVDIEEVIEDKVLQSLVIPDEQQMQWAHRALVVLLYQFATGDEPIRWREVLRNQNTPISAIDLRKAAEQGRKQNIVRLIGDVKPNVTPAFLKDVSYT